MANYNNTAVAEYSPVQLRKSGFRTPVRTVRGTSTGLKGPVAVVIGR